jgi:hypothetical protein
MSNQQNDAIEETKHEAMEELKPQDLPENLDKTFLVEQDLYELGVILSRLSLRGVDKRILSDVIINNLNYHNVNEICGHLDSFLRSIKY